MKVYREAIIEKPVKDVWEVMGNQFTQVHLWSSNFKDSKPGGTPNLPGLDYLYRDTITDRGQTIQQLDKFDSEDHVLTYHITKGIPKIAKKASGDWSLEAMGPNKTKVRIEFLMEPNNILAKILSPIIKLKLGKVAQEVADELKYYLENSQPHPRNLESQTS
jgi:hypothetical protein